MVQLSHLYMTTGKTVALTIQTFVDKVMSLLLNMHLSLSASLVAQMVKNSPAMRGTWVLSLVWEDPLENGMATHASRIAWRIILDKYSLFLHSTLDKHLAS